MIDHYSQLAVCEFLIYPSPRHDQPSGRLASGHLKRSVGVKARRAMGIDSTCRELASRISTSRLKMVAELLDRSRSSCVAD